MEYWQKKSWLNFGTLILVFESMVRVSAPAVRRWRHCSRDSCSTECCLVNNLLTKRTNRQTNTVTTFPTKLLEIKNRDWSSNWLANCTVQNSWCGQSNRLVIGWLKFYNDFDDFNVKRWRSGGRCKWLYLTNGIIESIVVISVITIMVSAILQQSWGIKPCPCLKI